MTAKEFQEKHSKKTTRKSSKFEEDNIQMRCVSWFREHYPDLAPLLFHPNNEAYFGGFARTPEERAIKGKRAKDKGVTPGVADLILLFAKAPFHGLCIEMKTMKGSQEPAQREWQRIVERNLYRYEIVRSFEQFQNLIESYTGRKVSDNDEAVLEKIFGKPIKIHKK